MKKTAKTASPAQTTTTRRPAAKTSKTSKTASAARAASAAAKAEALLPDLTRDALGEVTETLEFMWSATQAVFGDKATPDHAIALLPFALDALELRRLLTERSDRSGSARARG